jgi:hypothetical protein
MYPIYEQGKGQGIGHSYDSFFARFQKICQSYISAKKAHAFAIIIYDFQNTSILNILKSQGGFAKLDRLSGSNLTVFYIDSKKPKIIDAFNEIFRKAFEIDEKITSPFVIFVKFDGEIEEVKDFKISLLEQQNYLFAFDELYATIKEYIEELNRNNNIRNQVNHVIQVAKYYKNILEFISLLKSIFGKD